jgi:methanogenic corrinoid protein MtbC1
MATEERIQEILTEIRKAVVEFEEDDCTAWCETALKEGLDAYDTIMQGLAVGMDRVGELYTLQEYFVPELLLCSDALYAGLGVLRPHLRADHLGPQGKVILGVVEGDIHDIGKNLVKTMFEAAGWDVLDLGKDVKLDRFVEEQGTFGADVIGLSALMTTSMLAMEKLVGMLKERYPDVRIIVGGAPLNSQIATQYGADGFAGDAVLAVKEATRLLQAA